MSVTSVAVTNSTPPPPLPRLADLTAVTPFAERWRVVREMHAATMPGLAAVELAVRRHGGPYSTAWPDGFLTTLWTRTLANVLIRCPAEAYLTPADVLALRAACRSRELAAAVEFLYGSGSVWPELWLDRDIEAAAIGGAHGLERLARVLSNDFRVGGGSEWDDEPDGPASVGGCVLRALQAVWSAMPDIAPGRVTPAHPESRPRSLDSCLADLYQWATLVSDAAPVIGHANPQRPEGISARPLAAPPCPATGPTPDGSFQVDGWPVTGLGAKQLTLVRGLCDPASGRPFVAGVDRLELWARVYGSATYKPRTLSNLQRDTNTALAEQGTGMMVKVARGRTGQLILILPAR